MNCIGLSQISPNPWRIAPRKNKCGPGQPPGPHACGCLDRALTALCSEAPFRNRIRGGTLVSRRALRVFDSRTWVHV